MRFWMGALRCFVERIVLFFRQRLRPVFPPNNCWVKLIFVAQTSALVRYHRNSTNIGLYRNFDRAFELSSGKYFKWAADSDFYLDGLFEKCVVASNAPASRPEKVRARLYLLRLLVSPPRQVVRRLVEIVTLRL